MTSTNRVRAILNLYPSRDEDRPLIDYLEKVVGERRRPDFLRKAIMVMVLIERGMLSPAPGLIQPVEVINSLDGNGTLSLPASARAKRLAQRSAERAARERPPVNDGADPAEVHPESNEQTSKSSGEFADLRNLF